MGRRSAGAFPADYWRYFLMSTRPETKDSNFSWGLFIEKVNGDLNDTLGNFIHRTLTFIDTQFNGEIPRLEAPDADAEETLRILQDRVKTVADEIENCRLQTAANVMISISRIGNQYLNEKEPWNLIKRNRDEAANIFNVAAQIAKALAIVSAPFIPFAAEEVWKTLNMPGDVHEQEWDEVLRPLPPDHKIAKPKPLFKKIDVNEEELEKRLEKIRSNLGRAA